MKKTAVALLAGSIFVWQVAHAQAVAPDLSGLWAAKIRFGPDIRGPLILLRDGNAWTADIAAFRVTASDKGGVISFSLPMARGIFAEN